MILDDDLIKTYVEEFDIEKMLDELFELGSIQITAPLEPEPIIHMMMIDQLNKDFKGGSSIKPGNIRANMKNLVKELPELTTLIPTFMYDEWWLKIAAFLIVWKSLRRVATVELKKEHAATVAALWSNCNNKHRINTENGYNFTVQAFKQLQFDDLSWDKYIETIRDLEKNEHLVIEEDEIWMREWVSLNYNS